MWLKKLFLIFLAVATTGLILIANVAPGYTQNFTSFPYNVQFEDLQIHSDPTVPKAPVVIDGRRIFSVGKTGVTSAGERVALIQKELLNAIRDDDFVNVKL